ncbi:MAG: RHS repeat-associated core domain-containing protein, partial [Chlorobi bacterium]|nr:RHS repeat-associated core domain-containing protein [Chlorobiota bacterium]
MITKIIDPEKRSTEINYECTPRYYYDLIRPFQGMSELYISRINTIKEPTRAYEINYHEEPPHNLLGDYVIQVSPDYNKAEMEMNYNVHNVVSRFTKYDVRDNVLGDSLIAVDFSFDGDLTNMEYYRKVNIKSFDFNPSSITASSETYDTSSVELLFQKTEITPYHLNISQPYNTPNLIDMSLVESISKNKGVTTINKIEMKRSDSLIINPTGTRFLYLPETSYSYIIYGEGSDTLLSSKVRHEYEFERINDNFGSTSILGMGIKQSTTKIYSLTDTSEIVYEVTNDYLNLKDSIIDYSHTNEIWDVDYNRRINDSLWSIGSKTSIEESDMVTTNHSIIPPLYGLSKSTIIKNKLGDTLAGHINEIQETLEVSTNGPDRRRGAVISDTIIGRDGSKLLNANYQYTGGWTSNFLEYSKNEFGAHGKVYYSYNDAPDYSRFQDANGNSYYQGKVLKNNNGIDSRTFYRKFHEYESSLVADAYIRKYNSSGLLYVDTLRVVKENSYGGTTANIRDANGWVSSVESDLDGRTTKVRLPFDFPTTENCVNSSSSIPIFDIETIRTSRLDTVFLDDTEVYGALTHISRDSKYYEYIRNGHFVGNRFFDLRLYTDSTVVDTSVIVTSNYITKFKYHPNDNDALNECDDVDSLYFKLNYTSFNAGDCMGLKFTIKKINFSKTIFLGCPPLDYMVLNVGTPSEDEGDGVMRIDLTDYINEIKALADTDSLVIEVSTISLSGEIEFLTTSIDTRPQLVVKCNTLCEEDDYTYSYEYDDNGRILHVKSKIDDILHKQNKDWLQSNPDILYGRYSGAKGYFGADDRLFEIDKILGNPFNISSPVANVKRIMTGGGVILRAVDPDGNITYFDSEKMVEVTERVLTSHVILSDSNMIKTKTTVVDPSADPVHHFLTGNTQDYYGLCSITETGYISGEKVNYSYVDAFGNLRKTKYVFGDSTLTTEYEYNLSGELTQIVNPRSDVTKYWYDDFGRMIYRWQQDVGYFSYAYDNLGQLRFVQTEEQNDSNKVSFMEYDDLGRITVTGEATIDNSDFISQNPDTSNSEPVFRRLTDSLLPNVLNYSNYEGIYTANSTLWSSYSNYVPVIPFEFNDVNESTTFSYPRSYWFKADSCLLGVNSASHLSELYTPKYALAPAYNFENISVYPEFIRSVVHYDDFPERSGPVWSNIPHDSVWNNLVPTVPWSNDTCLRNLKGRQCAVAYRDKADEPFHYIVMSYDPRGRIEALLRFTENLGIDAVYYTYNSADRVIKTKVVGPQRQYLTWVSYDDNGRPDSVWTKLSVTEDGMIANNFKYTEDFMTLLPEQADISYSYNKQGMLDSVKYLPVDVTQFYHYSKRGWLDSMIAKGQYDDLFFMQKLERDGTGRINKQISMRHGQNDTLVQDYEFDQYKRLSGWNTGTDSSSYAYDLIGNRLSHIKNDVSSVFNYTNQTKPNRLMSVLTSSENKLSLFEYNKNGAVISRANSDTTGVVISLEEEFEYTSGGLLKQYTKTEYDPNDLSQETSSWRYRYSPVGGREQKRMVETPLDTNDVTTALPTVYYLLGAGGSQLATYHGHESKFLAYPGTRNIYFAVNSFLTGGGVMIRKIPNCLAEHSRKEFNIFDHLGSVRVTVSLDLDADEIAVKGQDYKPFGETIDENDETPRLSFNNQEQDGENNYFAMGARQYDAELGRFLSTDPLADIFQTQGTYNYSYNSPINWKDPSGLAPVDEKGRNNILGETDQEVVSEWGYLHGYYYKHTHSTYKSTSTPLMPGSMVETKHYKQIRNP